MSLLLFKCISQKIKNLRNFANKKYKKEKSNKKGNKSFFGWEKLYQISGNSLIIISFHGQYSKIILKLLRN